MSEEVLDKPRAVPAPAIQPALKGSITALHGDVLQGWAMDTTRPDLHLVIEVRIDGAPVALARADHYDANATTDDKFHGFAVQLRQSWLSEARFISAHVANQDFSLDGEIQLPALPSQDGVGVASQVWHTGGLRISGWSWDPQTPQRHMQITVRESDGTRVIAQAVCNAHHQALAYRDTSDHGFTLDLPWELADGKLHILEVMDDRGQALAGSPVRLCCWPEGLEGLLKQHDYAPDEQTLALLSQVAQEQTLRLPKSAGWQYYPQWLKAFQSFEGSNASPLQAQLGLLLISEGDEALEGISLDSLGVYRSSLHALETASPADILPALERLLEAGCEHIVPLVAGDHLAEHALPHLEAMLVDGGAWGYADCDRDGPNGERTTPWFKPVWDIDLFIGADIFTPGSIFTAAIVNDALALLRCAERKQTYNLHTLMSGIALATERNRAKVAHLPLAMYHRDKNAAASPEQAAASPARQEAIAWLCEHLAPGATVSNVPDYPALLRAHWPAPKVLPKVSLLVPTRDQYKLLSTCIEGLLNGTDYPDLEIIVVDNQSSDPQTLTYLAELKDRGVKVIDHPYPFNYSTINNRAAEQASGEIIGLVNNDIEIIDAGWLKEMVGQVLREGVGAVGAKLLWPNKMVQHGGVVVGINGLAAHTGNSLEDRDPGYLATNQVTRQQSAVTAACLLMKKSLFSELNGLDEKAFPVAFNDVDLCMRIRSKGYKLIWSAFARLIHAESASRGKDIAPEKRARAVREQQGFTERWFSAGEMDPYYHPALSIDYLSGPYGGLAMPPRSLAIRWHNG